MVEPQILTKPSQLWLAYLQASGSDPSIPAPPTWSFGDSPQMASQLGRLVYHGLKTATCSLLWQYEDENEPLPKTGELSIILDGHNNPLCIIRTIQVQSLPFNQVSADFAFAEGEGDRSLAHWREAHWRFFSRACASLGRQPAQDMPLVCERFQLVFRA